MKIYSSFILALIIAGASLASLNRKQIETYPEPAPEVAIASPVSFQEEDMEFSVPVEFPKELTKLSDTLYVYLENDHFRQTFKHIMECESHGAPKAYRKTIVKSVEYEVLGAMQMLYDSKIRDITHEFGYVKEDLLTIGPNVEVAQEWYKRNKGWWPWIASHNCWKNSANFTP